MSANPIYHLKDCYFFEVPKAMWRQGWKTLDDVPAFLRTAHPEVGDVREFNAAMDGKILIPQPFAQLESLYSVKSGFGISKYMILELIVAAALFLIFTWVAARLRSGGAPRGRMLNLFESMLVFVRDQIARPAIDDPHAHDHAADDGHQGHGGHGHAAAHALPAHEGDAYVPLLWTLFFLKTYPKQALGCSVVGASAGAVDPKTMKKWVWDFIDRIGELVDDVVSTRRLYYFIY
jgi:hypothetical protein